MSDFKSCPVCKEQSDQCLPCASYVVDGERIYYEKLKDFGATKDHEVRFINRIQKQRTTAFFHNGKLYIPSRQGRSVPLAIGLQWDAWQEQQAKIDEYYETGVALNTETINQRRYILSQSSKINELQNRVDGVSQVLCELKESMDGFKEMDLYDKGHRVTTEYVIADLEQALRGEHETN